MVFIAKDGTEVPLERWGFCITYDNGEEHHQFDVENKRYNNFNSIDLDRVTSITMKSFQTDKKHSLDIPKDATLIHYYDNIVQRDFDGNTTHTRWYCYGYELNGEKKIYSIRSDDTVVEELPDLV